jgi:hypothetical protein
MKTGFNVGIGIGRHYLSWCMPDRVMCLELTGIYQPEDAAEINTHITQWMQDSTNARSFVLLLNATELTTVKHFEQIRAVQGYIFDPRMKYIFIATNNKLLRLAFMVMFKLSTAYVRIFDNWEELKNYIEQSIDALP